MSLFGSIVSGIEDVGKVAAGFATGGPGGAIGAIGSLFGGPKPAAPTFGAPVPGTGGIAIGGSIPGLISGGIAVGYSGGGTVAPSGGACPRGYHLNKHALPASKRHAAVAARTICVRNRHMNPLNHRADARALRRLKRADKMTRKIHNLFHRRHAAPKRIGRK